MKIAIPLNNGQLASHFGHAQTFAIIEANSDGAINGRDDLIPPPHSPGVIPAWLAEQGVAHVIAGGIGSRAQSIFTQHGITVFAGATSDTPESLVTCYLDGTLNGGADMCDH